MSATITRTLPTGTWSADPTHSTVGFTVKHLGIATVRGSFNQFEGTLQIDHDLASSTIHGTIEAASVDTADEKRDDHLRSPDFFDATQFPQLGFRSSEIRPVDEDTYEIDGELTIHGVTNPITLTAEVTGTEQDPWGNERVGLEVTGQLNRGDYGISFNQALGSGNLVVSDKVKLAIDISAVKQA
jgi:polyisoprenoid-binding protein YceI